MTVPLDADNPTDRTAAVRSVAVVTGAGRRRGIGRAIARQLARDGFAVVVHERRVETPSGSEDDGAIAWRGAASVVDEIVAAGGSACAVSGDVTEEETAHRLVGAAASLGQLAVLVNNHGTAGEANAHFAHETSSELWDETLRVNLGSLRTLTSVLVPAMRDSGATSRSIVHLSSTAGHRALPRYGAYCVSKAAVERLTEQQALELARHGIRVNCVAPGMTPTDMIDGTLDRAAAVSGLDRSDIEERARRSIPLRRFAAPEDIAHAVAFLAGDAAAYITGQVLTVDGGMTLA
jgi:NAD(P)-dependent dehydrogenase (short-subunit alcohol dehydrogenase family)